MQRSAVNYLKETTIEPHKAYALVQADDNSYLFFFYSRPIIF